jgi:hypothetical protein
MQATVNNQPRTGDSANQNDRLDGIPRDSAFMAVSRRILLQAVHGSISLLRLGRMTLT